MTRDPRLDTYDDLLQGSSDPDLERLVRDLDRTFAQSVMPARRSQEIERTLEQAVQRRAPEQLDVQDRPTATMLEWSSWTRLAAGTRHSLIRLLRGGGQRRRSVTFAAVALIMAVFAVQAITVKSTPTVSAQEILDRSYAAEMALSASTGIRHTRSETYRDPALLSRGGLYAYWDLTQGYAAQVTIAVKPGAESSATPSASNGNTAPGTKTIDESYLSLQSGKFRSVFTDGITSEIVAASAHDGEFSYTSQTPRSTTSTEPLTIYRTRRGKQPTLGQPLPDTTPADLKSTFDLIRQSQNTRLAGQETWADGRTVYVLNATPMVTSPVKAQSDLKPAEVVSYLYFDARTYQYLESRVTIQRDGKEIIASYTRMLVNEILPDSSRVAWDLSDLPGIKVVDDPERQHGDQPPEVVTQPQLAERGKSAYMLRTPPQGYAMEMSLSPQDPAIYAVVYADNAGSYFRIMGGGDLTESMKRAEQTLKTASGLTLYVMPGEPTSGNRTLCSVVVASPNGAAFYLVSTLPRERVLALAEELIPVK